MIAWIQKYLRLKMKFQVEAERYELLRRGVLWEIREFGVPDSPPLKGKELDRALDEYQIKVLRKQIEGLNESLTKTSAYDSGIAYVKERAKLELRILEIEERWA